MFDILAPGYDTFSHLFSFGMDRSWKARLIEEGVRRSPRQPRLLDLACGTGDLCEELKRAFAVSEIGHVQRGVGEQHADERDGGKIEAFRDHLCAEQNVRLLGDLGPGANRSCDEVSEPRRRSRR